MNLSKSAEPPLPSAVLALKDKQSELSLRSGEGADSKESLHQSLGNQAKFAAYGLSGGRDKYVLAVTETSSKFVKVQVSTPHVYGQVVVEVKVNEWDNKM